MKKTNTENNGITLNSYIAQSGVCSRRNAVDLIKNGDIKVNGIPITECSQRINPSDIVTYKDEQLTIQAKVYILLNKPIGYISTVSDEHDRKTVLDLVSQLSSERLYPVGRLDKETTGLLLLTNDGQFAQQLAHPKFNVSKIYRVTLHKHVHPNDLRMLERGIELEDGFISVNRAHYTSDDGKTIELEITSGRNRIVRRMFQYFGYEVLALDRTKYAFLTKKNIPLGKARLLDAQEISLLNCLSREEN